MESVSSSDVLAKSVMGGFLQAGVWCGLEWGSWLKVQVRTFNIQLYLQMEHSTYLPRGEEPVDAPSVTSTHILVYSR